MRSKISATKVIAFIDLLVYIPYSFIEAREQFALHRYMPGLALFLGFATILAIIFDYFFYDTFRSDCDRSIQKGITIVGSVVLLGVLIFSWVRYL